jgi:hypothetical protein
MHYDQKVYLYSNYVFVVFVYWVLIVVLEMDWNYLKFVVVG